MVSFFLSLEPPPFLWSSCSKRASVQPKVPSIASHTQAGDEHLPPYLAMRSERSLCLRFRLFLALFSRYFWSYCLTLSGLAANHFLVCCALRALLSVGVKSSPVLALLILALEVSEWCFPKNGLFSG